MRVERIAKDKVRIFVSYEDLAMRGIEKDELWKSGKKVQELFWDMMETAYAEVGFEVSGPIAVEAFTMPAEGVVIIVTRVPAVPNITEDDPDLEDEDFEDPFYSFPILAYQYSDFEDVLSLAFATAKDDVKCSLFSYENAYFVVLDEIEEFDKNPNIHSVLCEYGEPSSLTKAYLDEYGKCIFPEKALENLRNSFL
ncbi:NDP-hexose 2,3-dehydratase [Alicyclobacillus sp. TC]|uniref:adaptor protein MecA n=1 Tax=Alicyclobacillus sp. TC TaxID=2606450 RepID=UPI001932A310|nr:adaptor protein MecA [Alicyclobacillus sp. TC]QRF23319.1 NDP-hexose 2,3-dehydratase [Alicyclobacillus sp. TC]